MNRLAAIAAMLGAGGALALSAAEVRQSPATPPRTALILGQVVDGSNDRPMAGVAVMLNSPSATPAAAPIGVPVSAPSPRRAIADANGRFVFAELAAGRY